MGTDARLLAGAMLLLWVCTASRGLASDTQEESNAHRARYNRYRKLGFLSVQREVNLTSEQSRAVKALIAEEDKWWNDDLKRVPPPNTWEMHVEEAIKSAREYNKANSPRRRRIGAQFFRRCEQLLDSGRLKRLQQIT
jgi:hypothetical protein